MKKIAWIWLVMMLFSAVGRAETQYVSGVLEITLRTGPGTEHRVLEMIKTGQEVTILSTDNKDWTQIQLPNGRQGWVLKRFITEEKPHAVALVQTSEQNEQLSRQVTELLEENAALKDTYSQAKSALAEKQQSLAALNRSYESLKVDASEFIGTKARYKEAAARLVEQTKRADEMEAELNNHQTYQNIKWFLSGAGVLLVGFLLGMSAKKQRRKSSLL